MTTDLRWFRCLVFVFLFGSAFPAGTGRAADPGAGPAAAGWEEYTPGRWLSRADRKVEARPGGISAEIALSPRSGVAWEKKGTWDLGKGSRIVLDILSGGTNAGSDDYRDADARFPVSVTAVFGRDRQDLPWKTRIGNFFRGIRYGFSPKGIRLTYAFGNRAPVGSMYRLDDEETVFILGGEEEKGKKIAVQRDLLKDFLAAYGRFPGGPATGFVVRADRPSGERGPLPVTVSVSLPGP